MEAITKKKKWLLLWVVCITHFSAYGQENPAVTEKLKSKYGYACYLTTDVGGWYLIKHEGKQGACNLTGKEIIPPIWDKVRTDSEGTYYSVEKNGKIGIRDINNKELLPPDKYTRVKWYQKKSYGGYCEVEIEGKRGAIDLKNNEVIPCHYDDVSIYQLKEDVICDVILNGKAGVYDVLKNIELLPPDKYTRVRWYQKKDYGGYCEVEIEGRCGVIDKNNNEVIPCKYDEVGVFSLKEQNQCPVTLNGKKGVYDIKQSKEIIPCKYDDIRYWELKLQSQCTIMLNEKYGVYDIKSNKEIITCKYGQIGIGNNVATIAKGGNEHGYSITGAIYALYNIEKKSFLTEFKYGYIDYPTTKKENLIRFNFGGKVASYKNNYPVVEGGKWGYMDFSGKEIIPAQYDDATYFSEGIAQVMKNGVTSMITNPLYGTTLKMAEGQQNATSVDTNVPHSGKQTNENMFAFIFAMENYVNLSGADYAINDGRIFSEYCKKTMGIPDNNVRYYEDATYGNIVGAIKKMKDIADVYDGEAKIIFYFAGLGATDENTKERYLLPADASMATLATTGYSFYNLQQIFNEMNTDYTLVIIDAPFSNVDRTGKPLTSSRGISIAPKNHPIKGNVVICTASKSQETAFASKEYRHGLFTYSLLQHLQETKGRTILKDWVSKAALWVNKEALRFKDKTQTPQINISPEIEKRISNLKL